jgi:hypothetical protein
MLCYPRGHILEGSNIAGRSAARSKIGISESMEKKVHTDEEIAEDRRKIRAGLL